MTPKIVIGEPLVQYRKLTFKLSLSRDIEEYFLYDHLEFQYDVDIEPIPPSVLSIPAVSTLVCVAWAAGADILVQDIDEAYLNSLANVEKVFADWFPRFSFSTRVRAGRTPQNRLDSSGSAVLFTGGVDSLSTYLRHRDEHPVAICIWGASHPFSENRSPKKRREWENNFRRRNVDGSRFCFVSTNAGNLINESLLASRFIKEDLGSDDWWETVSHGLALTGIAAPVTVAERTANLFMASSFLPDARLPNGSHVFCLADMNWATTSVVYDSSELSRQDKIRTVLKGNPEYYPYLQVCDNVRARRHNCGHCEKCLRTIVGLIMEDIDPNRCNFTIHDGILEYVKSCLQNGWILLAASQILCWKDIQDHVGDHSVSKLYGAGAFFDWYRDFNLSDYRFRGNTRVQLARQFFRLARYDALVALRLALKVNLSAVWSVMRRFGSLPK